MIVIVRKLCRIWQRRRYVSWQLLCQGGGSVVDGPLGYSWKASAPNRLTKDAGGVERRTSCDVGISECAARRRQLSTLGELLDRHQANLTAASTRLIPHESRTPTSRISFIRILDRPRLLRHSTYNFTAKMVLTYGVGGVGSFLLIVGACTWTPEFLVGDARNELT